MLRCDLLGCDDILLPHIPAVSDLSLQDLFTDSLPSYVVGCDKSMSAVEDVSTCCNILIFILI